MTVIIRGKSNLFISVITLALGLVYTPVAFSADWSDVPPGAQEALETYTSAFNRGDCEKILEVMSPAVIRRLDERLSRAWYCEQVALWHEAGSVQTTVGVVGVQSEGAYQMTMVEVMREAKAPDSKFVTTHLLHVMHSSDGGASWAVLDNNCTDEEWLREVYPPYDGEPAIPGADST